MGSLNKTLIPSLENKTKNIDSQNQEKRILQSLDRLLFCYKRSQQSATSRRILQKVLMHFIDYDLSKADQKDYRFDYIFRAKQARQKGGRKINLKPGFQDQEKLISELDWIVDNLTINWTSYQQIKHLQDWVVFLEIEKIRIGIIAYFYDISSLHKPLQDKSLPKPFC